MKNMMNNSIYIEKILLKEIKNIARRKPSTNLSSKLILIGVKINAILSHCAIT